MSDSETPTPAPASAPRKRSKLLLIAVPMIVLLSAGGAGGWWYMRGLHAAPAEQKVAAPTEPTGLLVIDPFTINLADPGGRRYLRLGMRLVLPDAAEAKKVGDEELVMSRVRSALLEVLSSRTAVELSTPEGRAELKKAIADTAAHTGHMDVRDVLFQEFVVQ